MSKSPGNDPKAEKKLTEVADWLMKTRIPSFSPTTGMVLLKIKDEIREGLEKDKSLPIEIRSILEAYAKCLYQVGVMGMLHQGAVIGTLSAFVEGSKNDAGHSRKGS